MTSVAPTVIDFTPVITTMIAVMVPITIAVIVGGFKISNSLIGLKTEFKNQSEQMKEVRRFNEKCKAGEVHTRPFQYCYKAFLTKDQARDLYQPKGC